jgi:hypothetical protein
MKPWLSLTILTLLSSLAASAGARPPPPTPGPPKPSLPAGERPVGDQTAIEPAAPPTTTEAPPPQVRDTAITATLLVKVVHPDEVRAKVIAKTKELGGFPVLVSDGELQLKVPPESVATVLDLLAGSGTVLDKSLQRRDRTEVIAQLEARLRSKREIFVRLRKFLDDSNVSATLKVEGSMTQLVRELEQIKGELEVERASTRHALVIARFEFHREGRITYVRSPFAWLNTVDLDHFLAEFGR